MELRNLGNSGPRSAFSFMLTTPCVFVMDGELHGESHPHWTVSADHVAHGVCDMSPTSEEDSNLNSGFNRVDNDTFRRATRCCFQ